MSYFHYNNFALDYTNKKVKETNLDLDMNGTHQVLAYADDLNSINDDITKNIERMEMCYQIMLRILV